MIPLGDAAWLDDAAAPIAPPTAAAAVVAAAPLVDAAGAVAPLGDAAWLDDAAASFEVPDMPPDVGCDAFCCLLSGCAAVPARVDAGDAVSLGDAA